MTLYVISTAPAVRRARGPVLGVALPWGGLGGCLQINCVVRGQLRNPSGARRGARGAVGAQRRAAGGAARSSGGAQRRRAGSRRGCPARVSRRCVALKRLREQQRRQWRSARLRGGLPAAEAEAQAPSQDLASPGLNSGPARPQHSAPDRGSPRLALPRDPASRAGDEAGRQPRGAQHKGLFLGASAAAAAAAAASLEPPAEAEPAPGPSSLPVPGGGCWPSPRGPGSQALSPLFPRLRWVRAAAHPPLLWVIGAPRSMSEGSDMEKAIKETSILEEYNINWTQKLGAGISGPVRVCVKKSTQERFALKILLDRPKARNEVRLHVMCATHPNIVQIIEVFANSVQFPHESSPRARLLIVMEMMEGGELFHRISQHRHFTEKQASQVTKQIALALQHCHLLNIAHRDLKPENLLFKDNSLDAPVKLCDFGFAKIDQGDLMTPQFTPYYVAPQVLEAQRRHQKEKSGIIPTSPTPYTYNKSCDLWSLGVIIYVMLCGYPPFYSKHHSRTIPKDMRRKIMTGSFEFPEEEWSQISEMAKDVVRKLLKVKPEERLTIEGVLDHPWLNSTEALDNVLPSAQLMMDKAVVAGIQQAHAEQLANMRIQDLKVSLKPLHSVNNPILRKRKLLGTKPKDGVYIHDRENGAEDSNVALEKLRDVIAQCILPQAGENEDEKLNEVVQEAWKYNRECKLLRDTLQSFSWNGRGFTDKVDRLKLAEIVKQVIEEQTTSHESQ
nr:MAP kinase-activated protein kinase 5 isoform X2 [Camelus dromedarius]